MLVQSLILQEANGITEKHFDQQNYSDYDQVCRNILLQMPSHFPSFNNSAKIAYSLQL